MDNENTVEKPQNQINQLENQFDQIENQPAGQLPEDESIIAARERRVAEARKLTLFSDVFMTTALKDPAACHMCCVS